MAIVDSQSGKLVAAAPIGEGSDAVAFDSKRGLVLSSNGESGNLTILHQDSPDQYADAEHASRRSHTRLESNDRRDLYR